MAKANATKDPVPTGGQLLREWREACGMGQERLAAAMSASVSTISLAENSERRMSYEMAMAACSALGLPPWLPMYLDYYQDKSKNGFVCRKDDTKFAPSVIRAQEESDALDKIVFQLVQQIRVLLRTARSEIGAESRMSRRKAIIDELRASGRHPVQRQRQQKHSKPKKPPKST